jgi:hypothetical protein
MFPQGWPEPDLTTRSKDGSDMADQVQVASNQPLARIAMRAARQHATGPMEIGRVD